MSQSLWNFSLATYARTGVPEACLHLQDALGADVNILLYCCWRGAMEKDELISLAAELAPWQTEVVGGLRKVRRFLKLVVPQLAEHSTAAAQLRERVKELELEAEKLQQSLMADHAARHTVSSPPSPVAAARNLRRYFALLQRTPDGGAKNALETLVAAAFPEIPQKDVVEALATH
jgi:uncharacterized protein (TIGR02444 family)